MHRPNRIRHRIAAVLAIGCVSLAFAGTAEAVDMRDWGRKLAASERFVVLSQFNSEAVLDKETQLVWRRTPVQAAVWHAAHHYCLVSAVGDRGGWRLPTYSELTSLIGTTASSVGGVLPAGHPFQNIGAQDYYWSNTDASNTTTDYMKYAYTKALLLHSSNIASKATPHPYLCVRGVGSGGDN